MISQTDTIHSLIRAAGGDAELSLRCGLRPGATKKWPRIGVPEKHWSTITAVTGVGAETLHALNEHARKRYRNDSDEIVNKPQQGDAA